MPHSEVVAPERRPGSFGLLALASLTLLSPLLFQAFGDGVGAFSMFTRPERYRLRLIAERPGGAKHYVPLPSLAPHLGKDARRIVLEADDWHVGEAHVSLLASGLGDLGRLACRLAPGAAQVHVVLERASISHVPKGVTAERVSCGAATR